MYHLKEGTASSENDTIVIPSSFPSNYPFQFATTTFPTVNVSSSNTPTLSVLNTTSIPSLMGTVVPSTVPTNTSTAVPTYLPTSLSTNLTTEIPTVRPSASPSLLPSVTPTTVPIQPSFIPSVLSLSSAMPSSSPSVLTSTFIAVTATTTPLITNRNIIVIVCLSLAVFLCSLSCLMVYLRRRRRIERMKRFRERSGEELQYLSRKHYSDFLGSDGYEDGEEKDDSSVHSGSSLVRPTSATTTKHSKSLSVDTSSGGGHGRALSKSKITVNPLNVGKDSGPEFYC